MFIALEDNFEIIFERDKHYLLILISKDLRCSFSHRCSFLHGVIFALQLNDNFLF